eukprot:TRINITY_DN2519_c0_g1_i3.p1 TRINITY_DN2519_c0_g1~~TRINITY_DN2519_c0_g1_i3.p1  ORF type:complete len:492 (-),score=97.84 TRINITY_DN2519_c0_g1_i3:711-2186(-)
MGHTSSKEQVGAGKDGLHSTDDRIDFDGDEEEVLSKSREVRLLIGHEDIVRCVIQLDDHRIASASDDSMIMIWCSVSGEKLFRLSGHMRPVTCMIAMKPNLLITGSSDKTIRIWDTEAGKCLHTLPAHDGSVTCLMHLDHSRFISGGNDRKLFIWSTEGKRLGHIERQEEENLYCLLPICNNKVVTGSNSSLLLVYKTDTKSFDRLLAFHRESVRCLLHMNDSVFISASLDGVICIWNSDTLTAIRSLNKHEVYRDSLKAYKYSVRSMAPFGESYIVAAVGYGFGIFNTSTGATELERLDAHEAEVTHIIPLVDKSRIVTCSVDSKIRVWTIKPISSGIMLGKDKSTHSKKAYLLADLTGHSGAVNALLACSDSHFVSAGADGLLIMWKESRDENRMRDAIATESLRRQMVRARSGRIDFHHDFLGDEDIEDLDDSNANIDGTEDYDQVEPEAVLASSLTSVPSPSASIPKVPSWNGKVATPDRHETGFVS